MSVVSGHPSQNDIRRFYLMRRAPPTEPGRLIVEVCVADGVLLRGGMVVLHWLNSGSVGVYSSWDSLVKTHHIGEPKHPNWTTACWLDGVCFTCGEPVGARAFFGGNGGQCVACSASWDGPPSTMVEPEKGTWVGFEMFEMPDPKKDG